MSKSKPQTVFKTPDGCEFATTKEAEAHADLMALRDAYVEARQAFGAALIQREKTADGQPFEFGSKQNHYLIVNQFFDPRIVEARFYWGHWDWFLDDRDRLRVRLKLSDWRNRGEEQTVEIAVSDLYADLDAARAAVLEEKRKRLAEKVEELAKLEASPREIRPN